MTLIKTVCLLFLIHYQLFGQQIPEVKFNHLYFVIDSVSIREIKNSDYIKNLLTSIEVHSTSSKNGESWTGTYMFGTDNYIELFDSISSGLNLPSGFSGLGFSVDKVGEINVLNGVLSKYFKVIKDEREKDVDGKGVPWFTSISIEDSIYISNSRIRFWVMEYKREYFDFKKLMYSNNILCNKSYLEDKESERTNKIISRFTGVVMKLTDYEKSYFSNYFRILGYKNINGEKFITPDNFSITLKKRATDDNSTIESIEFETQRYSNPQTVRISENVKVLIYGTNGQFIFN